MTTADEVLAELKSLGTAQNRKVYARHGIGENMYGVSFANLGLLTKRLKKRPDLAAPLWESGNHDARVLATMIADPAEFSAKQFETWAKDVDNPPLSDMLGKLVARSPHAAKLAAKWTRSKDELLGCVGWTTVGWLASNGSELEDDFFAEYLPTIERSIHKQKNRVRESMNRALISIGARSEALREPALQVAKTIGKVEVDHGETGCKTPDAAQYIAKTWAHREAKAKSH